MRPLISLRYKWVLISILSLFINMVGWGQTYKIIPSTQKKVTERVDTVYVADGVARELFIPELRNNDGHGLSNDWNNVGDFRYRWYVRWYRKDKALDKVITPTDVTITNATLVLGGTAQTNKHNASLKETSDGSSLFWYRNDYFYSDLKSTATGASTVTYLKDNVEDDIVICDISLNNKEFPANNATEIKEPTISIRYKFVIRNAKVIANRIQAKNNDPLIDEKIWTADGKEYVNVQLGMTANNYAWYTGETTKIVVGDYYEYQIDEGSTKKLNSWEQIISSLTITKETVLRVRAVNNNERSPWLYKYTLAPISGSGFMLEDSMLVQQKKNLLDMRREPDKHKDVYEMIGHINFDRGDSITLQELKDNVWKNIVDPDWPSNTADKGKWLDPEVTGYAPYNYNSQQFAKVLNRLTTLQNQYGLFRTANLTDVSKDGSPSFVSKEQNNYWFIAKQYNTPNTSLPVYDRTYTNTDSTKLGYFFFVDAANLPGRLVKIKLDGTLCSHTGILINFWVNNMTTRANETHTGSKGGKPLPPNINMKFIGKNSKTNEESVLHYFTSGDALTNYTMKEPYTSGSYTYETNEYIGKWQQLAYSFNLSENLNNYDEFYLEVQNNTIHSYGSDYAIDGLRIYKTKPEINVDRIDACSSNNLTVSTDYNILLRNMGWTIESDVLKGLDFGESITDGTKNMWKYRYGLMGNDAKDANPTASSTVGNVYFGITDQKQTGNPTNLDSWITLNKDLLEYNNTSYNKRSKVFRVIVPTTEDTRTNYFKDLTNETEAMRRQIILNLRMINNFLHDQAVWENDIEQYAITPGRYPDVDTYIQTLNQGLTTLCGEHSDYVLPDPNDNTIKAIIAGNNDSAETYEQLVRAVCSVMGITRIRVPWWPDQAATTINLSKMDVSKTELKYKGELNLYNTDKAPASGEYDVVIFSARAATDGNVDIDFPNASIGTTFTDPCLLTTPFTVLPSFTIVAKTNSGVNSNIVCEGRIGGFNNATVWVRKTDEANNLLDEQDEFTTRFPNNSYTFDWFLGTKTEYEESYNYVTALLKAYRNEKKSYISFEPQELIEYCENSTDYNNYVDELKRLLLGDADNEPRLIIGGKYGKAEFRWVKTVVAIPYFPESILIDNNKRELLFCEDPQERTLEAAPAPTLQVGFPGVTYPEDMKNVPLRIGLPNIIEGTINDIPIQKNGLTTGMSESDRLGRLEGEGANTIFLRQGQTYKEVGKLTKLSANKTGGGTFTMTFEKDAYTNFSEGQTYTLYIPFGEYNEKGFVSGSCEGYATLLVKIVPEYLTWQGTSTGDEAEAWYNDANWHQSTKGELYKDDATGEIKTDANGSDDINNAFAPLYFTRITIPERQTLELENLQAEETTKLLQIPEANASKATENIQYDMAVDKDEKNETFVTSYYINKVKEIYFKPEAKLRRQQYLTYDTARVEFEMTPNAKYWMASPLQSVFAGDMYTVKNTGRQNTYAFDYITYDPERNNRQAPAFYQKAWDKAITMYVPKSEVVPVDPDPNTVPSPIYTQGDLTDKKYNVVQSNWSREYNDVNVPYALGKGFYASVEKKNATSLGEKVLVRLPKADKSYNYEPLTKAPTLADRINSGKLADTETIEVVLADSDDKDSWWTGETVIADGDGKHFLLGNPYMYPLDIARFLKENASVLEQKYWTLDTKKGEGLVVGTPDVAWNGGEITGNTEATIAPMQAFFVELKGAEDAAQTKAEGTTTGADPKVRFTPYMMAGEPETASSSLRAATTKNPVLKLTAERDQHRSTALLTRRDDASNDYEADKDAVILLDTELKEIPQVYTIAGTRAVGVNATRQVDQVPLGVYADGDKGEVTLTIEGIADWVETLYLYDALTRKSVELTGDSYTLRLDGSSHGRYFLRSGLPTGNERVSDAASISVYSAVAGQVVASASEALKRIQVFTPMGRLAHTLYPAQPTCTFDLPTGIYIIRAEIAHDQKTVKLQVR